ncbi:MAG: NAD(P)H-quinone oxidoreductase [Acidobacteria bacterium]|jgi:putative PIG3 family NAD(P)H quinone oxidoreductase|nr:NAD(P)H-quinone oxidoreductase [Acidobacteriota bacterium]
MKAVYVKEFGGTENLEIREVKNPSPPSKTQILVKVKTSALNRADVLQRKGLYPAPKNFPERILGLEFAGEVLEIGDQVNNFKIGDRVFGITAGGAQAEFVLTEESLLARIPDNLNFVEAACVPEAFITAHDAIFTQGNLQAGETLLIHAVGSGVGLAALQLAKAKNIKTIGTSRNADKLEQCNKFGLDFGIVTETNTVESNPKALAEIIQHKNDGQGVDVILDLVGAKYFAANLESLAPMGRLILVGLTSGTTAEFNLGMALAKRARIFGTVLRSRAAPEKAEATAKFVRDVLPLIEKGTVVPNLDRVFRIEDVREAHDYLESNKSFGKVVLEF